MSGEADVSHVEVAAAVRAMCGSEAKVAHFQVAPASSVVQGFSSLILRVSVQLQQPSSSAEESVTFIVKRLPVAQSQLEVVSESDVFEREVLFFQHAAPLLRSKNADLPVVRCYSARTGVIVMEDLMAQGYKILANNMKEVGKNVLDFQHTKMIMEKLAKLHAASLDIDWLKILPYLNTDSLLEKKENPFPKIFKKACIAYGKAIKKYKPKLICKYSDWLESSEPFNTLFKFVKTDPKKLNVLGHGDFWVFNIMFKLHQNTKAPLDVKFIDFQMCRFVPPSRDIQNLLYTCMGKEFRDTYERDLLNAYVESFNDSFGCDRLDREDFIREYEESRLFGLLIAIMFRSMNHMPDLYPGEGETMTSEKFEAMMTGAHFDLMLERCEKDKKLETAVKEMTEELIQLLDKFEI